MKVSLILAAAIILPVTAWAQQGNPGAPQLPIQTVLQADLSHAYADIDAALNGKGGFMEQIRTLSAQVTQLQQQVSGLEQHQKDLDAYLAACQDAPGCTVPVKK